MTPNQRRAFQQLRELPNDNNDQDDWVMYDGVMDGTHELNISHEGGELDALKDIAHEWATT